MLGTSRSGPPKVVSSILLFRTRMQGLHNLMVILGVDKHTHLMVLEICVVNLEMVQASTILQIIEEFNRKIMDRLACLIIKKL